MQAIPYTYLLCNAYYEKPKRGINHGEGDRGNFYSGRIEDIRESSKWSRDTHTEWINRWSIEYFYHSR